MESQHKPSSCLVAVNESFYTPAVPLAWGDGEAVMTVENCILVVRRLRGCWIEPGFGVMRQPAGIERVPQPCLLLTEFVPEAVCSAPPPKYAIWTNRVLDVPDMNKPFVYRLLTLKPWRRTY